jgi:hypothetical protein
MFCKEKAIRYPAFKPKTYQTLLQSPGILVTCPSKINPEKPCKNPATHSVPFPVAIYINMEVSQAVSPLTMIKYRKAYPVMNVTWR